MSPQSVIERVKALFGHRQQDFVAAIQGLRAVAALTVVGVHLYAMPYHADVGPVTMPEWLQRAIFTGGRGVELFFIISGYLIPAALMRHRHIRKFLFERVMRIMPLFVILHVILFTVGPLTGYKFFVQLDAVAYVRTFLTNLFFVSSLFGDPIGQQNSWTLSYEWTFYIWFAAMFAATVRGLWPISLCLLAVAAAFAWGYPSVTFFGLGMLMSALPARLSVKGPAGFALGILCLAAMYYACEYITPYAGLLPSALLFALVLAPDSGFARVLATAPLQYIGKISYSLYLVHPFALFPLVALAKYAQFAGYDLRLIIPIFVLMGAVASVVASAIAYELVEVRLRRRLETFFKEPLQATEVEPRTGKVPRSG